MTVHPAKHEIILGDGTTYLYGSTSDTPHHTVSRTHVLHSPRTLSTMWPGKYNEVELPHCLSTVDEDFAVESCIDNSTNSNTTMWPPPDMFTSVAGKIRIPNLTGQPQTLKRAHIRYMQ